MFNETQQRSAVVLAIALVGLLLLLISQTDPVNGVFQEESHFDYVPLIMVMGDGETTETPIPTTTPSPTSTATVTLTPSPTQTSSPTETPIPTETPTPTNGQILFVSDRAQPEGLSYDIFGMDLDGQNVTQLTTSGGTRTLPQWSPDGTQIAFTDANDHLYVMNADGMNPIQLTGDPLTVEKIAWSPDGTEIAFIELNGVYVITLNSLEITNLNVFGSFEYDRDLQWSPDGSTIYGLSYNGQLYLMSVDRQTGMSNLLVEDMNVWGFDISPDGTKLLFSGDSDDGNLFISDLDGSNRVAMTMSQIPSRVRWNNIGDKIAYWAWTNGQRALFAVNADGSSETQVIDATDKTIDLLGFADEGRIIYTLLGDDGADIFTVRINGTDLQQLTSADADWERAASYHPEP